MALAVMEVSRASAAVTTQTVSWDHGFGSPTLLLVWFMVVDGVSNTVTFNGDPLTLAGAHTWDNYTLQFYYRVNPATGTNTIICDSGSLTQKMGAAVSFSGTHLSTPLRTIIGTHGTASPLAVDVETAQGDLVIDGGYVLGDASTGTMVSDQTQIWFLDNSPTASNGQAGSRAAGTGGLVSMGYSWTGPTTTAGMIAIAVRPAEVYANIGRPKIFQTRGYRKL